MSSYPSIALCLSILCCVAASRADNGFLQWGSLPSPNLSPLDGASLLSGSPWGGAVPGGDPPNTGAVRKYDLRVTREYQAPDGYNKSLILVNDQFPGPLLEANWGDTFQLTVTNNIEDEGISIHWHGLSQHKTPWYDGVPGVSQCPIAPGKSYTYIFQADTYGTGWYHSHYSGQYGDGLYGPMVIHGPLQTSVHYDFDLGPVLLQEYLHKSYEKTTSDILIPAPAGPVFFTIDNNLINGRPGFGYVPSKNSTSLTLGIAPSPNIARFNFTAGKSHRIRLINAGAATIQKFSIENHTLLIIANDYVPVVPYETDVVTLNAGQRTDIVVRAAAEATGITWMHADIDEACANTTVASLHAFAAISYLAAEASAPLNKAPGLPEWPSNACENDPLWKTTPFYPTIPPLFPATTTTINISTGVNASNQLEFAMNNSSFITDFNDPVLLDANKGQVTWPHERNVYDFGSNSSVRLILVNSATLPHPMHLHGHNFWILAEGYGTWDGQVTNPSNPQRRDTHSVRPASPTQNSYVVLEWMQDNPGVWPLHCHLAIHTGLGLYINVLERKDDIRKDMEIPGEMVQTCVDWQAWTASHTVDQIDSGV